jgi:HEAT repeat protein
MKVAEVDRAILARCREGQDTLFVAWAARGFVEAGRPGPPELVIAAVRSREPRARAEIAEVLASSAKSEERIRLVGLCDDENELVRVAAADAVKKHAVKDRAVLGAMVKSLDRGGDSARQRMVEALAKIAGKAWSYSPDDSESQRAQVISEVKRWWKAG